jgi:hypothetical protein
MSNKSESTPESVIKTEDGSTWQHQAYLSASEAVTFLVCFWMLDLSDFLECLWNEMLKKYKIYDELSYSNIAQWLKTIDMKNDNYFI